MQPDNQPNQPPDAHPPVSDPPAAGGPAIPQTTGDTNPTAPAVPASSVAAADTPNRQPALDRPKPKRNKAKLFAVIGVAAAVILGGSAAAYLGVYIPNQPENILKTALENTAKEKTGKFDGKASFESLDDASPYAGNVIFKGQGDSNSGQVQTEIEVNVSGVKVTLEAILADNAAYVKIGDLTALKGLAAVALPGSEAILEEANKKIANQWIEIDETLIKTVKADCALGLTKMSLTDQDMQIIQNRYKQVPFASIVSTSSEDVAGKPATKFELELDDNKLAEYGKELDELSVVKKLKECGQSEEDLNTGDLADNDKTPLTLWVDKDAKRIVKIAAKTTAKDEKESKMKGTLEMTMDYTSVQITKPEKSRPIMEVIGELGNLSQQLSSGQQ